MTPGSATRCGGPLLSVAVTGVALLVLALVSYRLTRLVVADTITARARTRALIVLAGAGRPRWADGLTCGFCMSVWCATGTVMVAWALGMVVGGWDVVLWVPAVAGASSLLWAADRAMIAADRVSR